MIAAVATKEKQIMALLPYFYLPLQRGKKYCFKMMDFEVISQDKDSSARAGKLRTDHGDFRTPAFMPVGTKGGVKGAHLKDLAEEIQADILLSNAYHLYLRPGVEVLQQAGGIHRFMQWEGPVLTDSGGYQVYSLAEIREIQEEGVWFQSHIDGSKHLFTPERVVDIQRKIGADFIMAFDECPPYPCEYEYAKESLHLTQRWMDRGFSQFNSTAPAYGYQQAMLPIVQGSVFKDLREKATQQSLTYNTIGVAIGGLSVGEPHDQMYAMTNICCDIIPQEKMRYLMGVGLPENILESIALGVDLFDCVIPTRNGRNGMIFTKEGIINIRNSKWKQDHTPLDADSGSFASRYYTKAYVRYLMKTKQMLGAQIATLHNLSFYQWLLRESRRQIQQGNFMAWKDKMVQRVQQRL